MELSVKCKYLDGKSQLRLFRRGTKVSVENKGYGSERGG